MGWAAFFKAVRRGEYKLNPLSWATLVGALILAVSPVDIIPEALLGPLGLADDAGYLAVAFATLMSEKNRFAAQLGKKPSRQADADIIDVEQY